MKKIIFLRTAMCICIAGAFHEVTCQVIANAVATNIMVSETMAPEYNSSMPVTTAKFYKNDISIRAVRRFLKDFREAKDVTWYKENNDGCTAQFFSDSVLTTVTYNRRGSFNYILRKYGENQTPADVRAMVKQAYRNFVIKEVAEFILSLSPGKDNIVYNILINDAENYKILKISKGQIAITSEYVLP